jgi:hypothetical protein
VHITRGKPEGKRLLGRPRRRWNSNFKTHLIEIILGVDERIILK